MKNFVSQFCDNENTIDLISLLEFKITNPICTCRDATGNPRNPFPKVPGCFPPPRSLVIRICLSPICRVPTTIPRGPRKATFLTIFFFLLKNISIKRSFTNMNILFSLKLSNKNKKQLYKIKKLVHSIFYHILLMKKMSVMYIV